MEVKIVIFASCMCDMQQHFEHLNRQTANVSLLKRTSEISYISLKAHHIFWKVKWNIKVSTYPQNGDIVVHVAELAVIPVIKSPCHTVNCSTKIVICWASSYCDKVSIRPIRVYGKMSKFALCTVNCYTCSCFMTLNM